MFLAQQWFLPQMEQERKRSLDPKTGMIKDANNNVLGAAMVSTANSSGVQSVSSGYSGLRYKGSDGNAVSAPAGSTFDPKTGMIKDANNNVLGAAMVSTANGTGTQTVSLKQTRAN